MSFFVPLPVGTTASAWGCRRESSASFSAASAAPSIAPCMIASSVIAVISACNTCFMISDMGR